LGILAIGFIATSTAVFLTSGSDSNRVLEFASIEIPAVNAQTLPWVSAGVLFLFLGKALLSLLLTKKAAFLVARVEARSARKIAEISFSGDLGDIRKRSREEVMFSIQAGSPAAFNGLLNSVNSFITEATLFIVICLGFFLIDPITTLAAVAYFGIIAVVIQYFIGERMSVTGKIATEGAVQANSAISDLLSVFRELLVIGKRDKYIQAIYDARVATANSSATQYYLSGMPRYIIEAALLVGVGLFVLSQALSGDLVGSAATIGVFLSGGFRLSAAMLPLQSALLTIKATIPAAKTAHEILMLDSTNVKRKELVLKVPKRSRPSEFTNPIGVNLNRVSFLYPDSSVAALNSVSFSIQPGSQVALMGPSGAGKSTIADILCSVLSPTEGEVTFTSLKSDSGDLEVVGGVSYVPQRPGLVSGTILDNVALAEDIEKVDRTEALEALRLAHLDDLVASLPKGLDTMLGKLQDGLSGGQLQRLGIARALYTKPSLLVMDEATSALDAESEAKIQKTLAFLRGKVTVVLIAHRLNTIQHADKVVLVEEGRVKDSGTFKELIARNPSVEKVVNLMQIHRD
jgi:ATP-binding cassette subfamily C protein